jgi:hypothetical protein
MRILSENAPSGGASPVGPTISTVMSSVGESFGLTVNDGSAFEDRLGICNGSIFGPEPLDDGTTRVT